MKQNWDGAPNSYNITCTLREACAFIQSDQSLRFALVGYLSTQGLYMQRVKTNQTVRIPFPRCASNFVGIALHQLKLKPKWNQLQSIEQKSHVLNIRLGTMAHPSIIDRSSYYSWFGLSKSVGNSSFSVELFWNLPSGI